MNDASMTALSHYSIRTRDLDSSAAFYKTVLGLVEGPRPPFKFPGIWLYLGDSAGLTPHDVGVVHLVGITEEAEGLEDYLGERTEDGPGSGVIDHVAFNATGLPAMRARLRGAGLDFQERAVPAMGLRQIFVADPDGVVIELNFYE